jgi:hypothetical protein
MYTKYKDKGLVVLGFDPADNKQIALDLLRENGVTFPNIIDSSAAARRVEMQDYPMGAWPSSYILDRNGKVAAAWIGYHEGEPQAIAALQKIGGELADAIRRDLEADARESAAAVTAAAKRLFQAIRDADYDRDWTTGKDWRRFPAKDAPYEPARDARGWVRWVCEKFKTNPIVEVQLGKVSADLHGRPTIHYTLRLKDGEVLQGDLPFLSDAKKKRWRGQEGLDWHLRRPPCKEKKKG